MAVFTTPFVRYVMVFIVAVLILSGLLISLHRSSRSVGLAPSTSTVFQLQKNGTVLENLIVRQSGDILATRLDVPEVWTIDPERKVGFKSFSLPGVLAATGIAEVSPGVGTVSVGNFSAKSAVSGYGSWQIWLLDLNDTRTLPTRLALIPSAHMLNGMARLDNENILTVDSIIGAVYKININTGVHTQVIMDTSTMAPEANGSLGINGIKVRNGYVYYTNSSRQLFCRIAIDTGASPIGRAEIIARGFPQDDFDIADDGSAYIATDNGNSVLKVTLSGETFVLGGGESPQELVGGTACRFGVDPKGPSTLYVTTNGGIFLPNSGAWKEPAKIVAIRTDDNTVNLLPQKIPGSRSQPQMS